MPEIPLSPGSCKILGDKRLVLAEQTTTQLSSAPHYADHNISSGIERNVTQETPIRPSAAMDPSIATRTMSSNAVLSEGKVKKLRNRASVVCKQCKMKKIKCDRQKPCANCTKSHMECIYDYRVPKLGVAASVALKQQHLREMAALSALNHTDGLNVSDQASLTPESEAPSSASNELTQDIFRQPFKLPGDNHIFRKPSRTVLRTKFFNAMLNRDESFSRQLLHSFVYLMNNERKSWKRLNFSDMFHLNLLQTNSYDSMEEKKKEMNKVLETTICNNYHAILERLNYFGAELNKVLYNSFIPMGSIHLIFHHYFVMQPQGVTFRGVSKNYEYNFIAVITSLVELTDIFARCKNTKFNFPLLARKNEFNDITITLMNISNFRRKTSIFSVFTLLNLRLSLMVYGDVQSAGIAGQNSYPYFQHALSLCMEMGVHLDQDTIVYQEKNYGAEKSTVTEELMFCREVSKDSIKALWNYMLCLDGYYYIQLGIPPTIDERYCRGAYDVIGTDSKLLQSFVDIVRDISLFFAMTRPVTISELFSMILKLCKLTSRFDSFENIKELESQEEKWHLIRMKFQLLKLQMSLLTYLFLFLSNSFLKEEFTPDVFVNNVNMAYIKKLREEVSIRSSLVYFIAIEAILQIASLSDKFILYNRDIFSDWFGLRSMNLIDISVAQDMKQRSRSGTQSVSTSISTANTNTFSLPETPQFEIKSLEIVLFDYNEIQHAQEIALVAEISKPALLAAYLTEAYEKVISLPILHTDYSFFIMTKFFLITIYSLYCYIHIDSKVSVTGSFDKLKDLTKRIIEKNQRTGVLTHALSADQIKSQIDIDNAENGQAASSSNFDRNGSLPITPSSMNTESMNTSNYNALSQMDDLFDSESLNNIFNDINLFMNHSETYQ
jgi:hypothetical protein